MFLGFRSLSRYLLLAQEAGIDISSNRSNSFRKSMLCDKSFTNTHVKLVRMQYESVLSFRPNKETSLPSAEGEFEHTDDDAWDGNSAVISFLHTLSCVC